MNLMKKVHTIWIMTGMRKIFAVALLIIIGCGGHMTANSAASSTEAILLEPGFREGLVWTGTKEPSGAESDRLLRIVTSLDQPTWSGEVEKFLEDNPSSPWAASLHHAYASFCRQAGRTTKALKHWEAGWNLVKSDQSQNGRMVRGAILTEWMSLLSSLGRVEK